METPNTDPVLWDDPDRAVQVEDDNPEALAGEPVEFDEAADDAPDVRITAEVGPYVEGMRKADTSGEA